MDNDMILDLLLFLKDKDYEVEENKIKVWVNYNDLDYFTGIFYYDYFCNCDKHVTLLYDCVAFDLEEFLSDYDDEDSMNYIREKLIEWSF